MPESHRQTPPRTPRDGVRRVRGMSLTALAGLGLFVLALSGVGGSYAMWNDVESVDAGTIVAGDAALAAQWASGHTDTAWANLLPGESVRQPLTLTNTGAAPLELSATVAVAGGFEIRLAAGTCPDAPLDGAAATGAPQALGVTLTSSASTTVCLEVRATTAATPGQTLTFTAQFDGKQVPR
ncbi:SipW-dependent-type signal peptide-containing protein [Microbacterium sp.]|uniref:SipW-dependent-type signal peptide-containing protein n=1 Tax=Microbacterium sp. TaxID=51671 RepID=UPI0039E4F4EA